MLQRISVEQSVAIFWCAASCSAVPAPWRPCGAPLCRRSIENSQDALLFVPPGDLIPIQLSRNSFRCHHHQLVCVGHGQTEVLHLLPQLYHQRQQLGLAACSPRQLSRYRLLAALTRNTADELDLSGLLLNAPTLPVLPFEHPSDVINPGGLGH